MKFRWSGNKNYPNPDDVRMTLGEHLEELRSRLIRAIVGLLAGAVLCFCFIDYVLGFLCWPIYVVLEQNGLDSKLIALHPAEGFITHLKVSLIVGLIVSAPYSLMQLWGFIAAGLYQHERKWVRRFVPVSIALFFTGAGFLLLIVAPVLLNFLITYSTEFPDIDKYMPNWMKPPSKVVPIDISNDEILWPASQPITSFQGDPENWPEGLFWLNRNKHEIRIRFHDIIYSVSQLKEVGRSNVLEPNIRIAEYVMFILHLAAAFGIGFQVPVVVAFLASLGIATAGDMARLRRYVWFGMAILSAFITPPDVTSMLFLLLPMALLFEVGLIVAKFIEKSRSVE